MAGLFSIVIPTYNSRRYSIECVESALSQTYQDIEVIVDDNASADGTGAALRERFGKDPRFRLFCRDVDLNIPEGWNRGMAEAKGEYLLLLHSDNLLHPQYVQTVIYHLEQFSSKVAYSEAVYFEGSTPSGLFFQPPEAPAVPFDRYSGGNRTVANIFRFERMIPISGVTLRRECLRGAPPFDLRYHWDPDIALMVRLAYEFGILHVRFPLVAIRTHGEQAPAWKDRYFPKQYDQLLLLAHEVGKTEHFHYLLHSSAAREDLCRRGAKIGIPFGALVRLQFRWFWGECRLLMYVLVRLARKLKRMAVTWGRWALHRIKGKPTRKGFPQTLADAE